MAAHPDRGPEYQRFRTQLRQLAFRELKSLEDPDLMVFMTACLGDTDEDAAAFAEHVDIARARDVPFLSFTLECDSKELRGRISAADRRKSARFKLADPGT
jgi:alkanesulfonate monooxygenase SsuD/methylene tetrahydromethanopterin reductase-like flavin-dependent oxidoreductase (luciferase family)